MLVSDANISYDGYGPTTTFGLIGDKGAKHNAYIKKQKSIIQTELKVWVNMS